MPATATELRLWAYDVGLSRAHLDASIERKCHACAVALAVIDAVGAPRFVAVAADGRIVVKASALSPHVEAAVDEPARVAAIVRLVDDGRADEVRPTRFRIWC